MTHERSPSDRAGPSAGVKDPAYPLGGEPGEGQVGAEVSDHRAEGVGVAASPVGGQRFGRQELIDSSS